eukprot:9944943-Ditylum_brightwellii.AAC.1
MKNQVLGLLEVLSHPSNPLHHASQPPQTRTIRRQTSAALAKSIPTQLNTPVRQRNGFIARCRQTLIAALQDHHLCQCKQQEGSLQLISECFIHLQTSFKVYKRHMDDQEKFPGG